MSFTEDFSDFFETAGHADSAIFTHSGAAAVTVVGVLNNEFFEDMAAGMVDIDGTKPVFVCAAADVSTVAKGDALTVNAVSYLIQEFKPDGTGVIYLILEAV